MSADAAPGQSQAGPHLNPAAPFDIPFLCAALSGVDFARPLHHLPTTPSTNTLALEAARAGARHGVWIADEQTAGRGRGAHTWHSAPGSEGEPAGLYLTALVSPPIVMQSALRLSLSVAIAVQSAIASTTGFRVPGQLDIRWPNDLLLNGRKCAGILIETAAAPALALGPPMLRYAVIGIGINLNHIEFPADLDPIATSLRRELPAHPILAREPLAAAVLLALHAELQRLPSPLAPRTSYLAHSTWLSGKRVRVEARDDTPSYTGTTAGLTPDGFLRVHGDDGQLHTVLSGGLRNPDAQSSKP